MLVYEKGEEKLTELESYFGSIPLRDHDPVLYEFLLSEKRRLEHLPEEAKETRRDELRRIQEALRLYPEDGARKE